MVTNERLLEVYNIGWKDCSDSTDINSDGDIDSYSGIERIAYSIGWSDYILGDDLSSIDLQTEEEIINKIKKSL